jgi:pimeloyl-ACP methyl ester carboxylesterase
MREDFLGERGIYYRVSEIRPHLPTIVFIHGLSGSSSAWVPYEEQLESRHNIVSPDMRGHGKSRKLRRYEDYAIEKIANDLVCLLDTLNVEQVTVVGHSFGTLVALALIRKSRRVTSVVFLSPTFGVGHAWWMPIARMLVWLVRLVGPMAPFSTKPKGHVDYSALVPTGDWSVRRIIPDVRNTGLRVYAYCLRHIWKENFAPWWYSVRMPTLIVHGKRDTIVSWKHAAALSELIPHARLVLLESANHILPVNDVADVTRTIRRFLDDTVRT